MNVNRKRSQTEKKENAHHAAGVADPSQLWRDVLPYTNAALSNALTSSQLHKKQWNSHNHQKKNIQQHEGAWKEQRRRYILKANPKSPVVPEGKKTLHLHMLQANTV